MSTTTDDARTNLRAELTRMANEVGAHRYTNRYLPGEPAHAFSIEQLERFAARVAAKAAQREREACAQACDQHARDHHEMGKGPKAAASRLCAAAIRARGAATGVQP